MNTRVRSSVSGYLVGVWFGGVELLWGPYPERDQAEAEARRLGHQPDLVAERYNAVRRGRRKPRPAPARQWSITEALDQAPAQVLEERPC